MATEVERLAVVVEANTRQFNNAMRRLDRNVAQNMNRAKRHVRGLSGSFRTLDSGVARVARTLGVGLLAGGTVAAVSGLGRAISGVVEDMGRLVDTADKVGVSVEALQQLRFAANQTGVDTRTLDLAMQRFARRVGEAANGTGELKDTLERLGISVRNSDGSMRSQVDVLKDLADAIQNTGSQQERLSIAFKAFDSEGAALVNTLADGSGGLRELMQLATDTGVVLEEDLAREAKATGEAFDRLSASIGTTLKRAVLSTLSVLGELKDELVDIQGLSTRSLERRLAEINAEISGGGATMESPDDQMLGNNARLNTLLEDRARIMGQLQNIRRAARSNSGQSTRAAERRFGSGSGIGRTVGGDDVSGGSSNAEFNRRQSVIDQLKFEAEQLGRTNEEQALYNRLRSAGVGINSEAGQAIAALSRQISETQRTQEGLTESMRATERGAAFLGNTAFSALDRIALQGQKAGDVLEDLALQIAKAAAQAILLGDGPLAGLLGGGGGGIGGGGFFKRLLGFAGGGNPPVNRPSIVGERGLEIFTPRSPGTITPNNQVGGGAQNLTIKLVDGNGNSVEAKETRKAGGLQLEVLIDNIVGGKVGERGSKTRTALQSSFGLSGQLGSR